MTPSRTPRRLLTALGTVLLAGALAACGTTVGGSATGAATPAAGDAAKAPMPDRGSGTAAESVATSAMSTTQSPSGGAEQPPLTVPIGRTGWFDGFAITVGQATATESFDGAEVELALTFTNVGRETATIPYQMSVEVAGAVATTSGDLPQNEIPAGATGKGTLFVAVPGDEAGGDGGTVDLQQAIDKIVLVYGERGDNRTLIPLEKEQPVDSVEPRKLDASGTMAQSSVKVDLRGGDLAPGYASGEAGKVTIDLLIAVSCAADCRASGYYSSVDYFTLTDPAGVTIVPDQDRTWYCCEAIYPGTVVQGDHANLVFLVDAPATGTWTLKYEDPAVTAEGFPAGSLTFTV